MKGSLTAILKRPTNLVIILGVGLLTASLVFASRRSRESAAAAATTHPAPELVAGPGRVEPVSEDIKIGS